MSKIINKKSSVRGTGMFAMPSKKDKARRPDRKQKHKGRGWE
jgi:hypothetical protein